MPARALLLCAVIGASAAAADEPTPLQPAAQPTESTEPAELTAPAPASEAVDAPTAATAAGASAPPQDELPEELPPLDDELLDLLDGPLAEPAPKTALPVRAFAQGRLRLELDDVGAGFVAGGIFTGRAGVEGDLGPARGTVVVGDGARVGPASPLAPLVPATAASFLYALHVELDVPLAGQPMNLRLGRFALDVADGRFIGSEAFDARGRTVDGARLVWGDANANAALSGLYLAPQLPSDDAAASGVVVVDGTLSSGTWGALRAANLTGYALLHRDGTPVRAADVAVTALTAGARAALRFELWGVTVGGGAGVDAQGSFLDESAAVPRGGGWHVEGSAFGRGAPLDGAPALRVDVRAEATGGYALFGRTLRTPAPTQHGYLGDLDRLAWDNTGVLAATVALITADELQLNARALTLLRLDPRTALVDPAGVVVVAAGDRAAQAFALTELSARVTVPMPRGAVDATWAVGLPGGLLAASAGGVDVVSQRLLVSLRFALDSEPGAPLPPL